MGHQLHNTTIIGCWYGDRGESDGLRLQHHIVDGKDKFMGDSQ